MSNKPLDGLAAAQADAKFWKETAEAQFKVLAAVIWNAPHHRISVQDSAINKLPPLDQLDLSQKHDAGKETTTLTLRHRRNVPKE